MLRWVSLDPSWTLQDVQAGLNVVIAFLCAGAIFVLVRYCWLLAARRVAQQRDVPAYSLLSLNTIGETIDVIWLLRRELFTARYKALLIQCIFVVILTVATLLSGFSARFSTRYGVVIQERNVNGTLAERATGNILYAEVDTNLSFTALQQAKFPQTKLLEYLPNLDTTWEYVEDQWNSSWSMECTYNRSTQIANPVSTGNCTDLSTEFPQVNDNYWDWTENATWYWQNTGWRSDYSKWRDWIIFSHGLKFNEYNDDLQEYTSLQMRTVTIYLRDIPWNNTLDDTNCNFAPGPIGNAFYTSCDCKLTRDVQNRSEDDLYYGAYPDASDTSTETSAYLEHYGNRFRKEASRSLPVTVIEGEELAMFYQAYQITKDTITSPYVKRKINAHVRVPQISIITLIICSAAGLVVLFGLVSYWIFLWRNHAHLDKTPQSKLDWMLQTLKKENDDHAQRRHRLSQAMASGIDKGEGVPLNRVDTKDPDRKSVVSVTSSNFPPSHDFHDDGFDTPILGANFSGGMPTSTWFPQQYERVSGHGRQPSFGVSYRNSDYDPIQQPLQSPYMYQGTQQMDTAYDPGRR